MITRALVLRPMLREKVRTALTIAGIAVGVAVIVAIQLANQSALRAFSESVDAIAGRANYQIASSIAPLDESILLQLSPLWNDGVRFAPVIDLEGMIEPDSAPGPGSVAPAQPVRLLAVDLLSDLHFRDYRYASIVVGESSATPGGTTELLALLRPDSVVVPAPFARERGLRLGSRIAVNILGQRRTLVVRGILEARGPATAFNGSMLICDIATAQRNFGMIGRLTRIDLLIPGDRGEALLSKIRLPPGARIERPSQRNERVEKMLRAFRVNLFALAGVALLVGMFLVYNTVLISILRRRRDVGVLRTLGTSPRQILAAFLTEGLLFGAIGSALGVALGYALATGILRSVGRTINVLYVATKPEAIELTGAIVATGLAVGLVLSLLSAVHPALEASRVPPVSMIRPGLQQRIASPRRLALLALVAWAAGGLMTLMPPFSGIAVGGYLSVLLIVIGFSLLAPSIVTAVSTLSAPVLERAFGLPGRLAAVSLPASLRRTSIASAALSLATGMMVAVTLMIGSFRETVSIWVDQTVSSDLWLRPSRGLSNPQAGLFDPAVADELAKVPFVQAVDRVRTRDAIYEGTNIAIGSVQFDIAARYREMPMVTPRSSKVAMSNARQMRGVVVSESFSLHFRKKVGDRVELPGSKGVVSFPITGIYRDYSNDRGVVMMDRAIYTETFGDRAINTLVIYLTPGYDREKARLALQASFGPRYGAFVVTNEEVRREVMRIFDQTFMITYALLGVAIIVAVLGIVNTLSALILERTRELALLRVGGFSSGQLRTMILLESTMLGLASTVAGLVMGYVLSWILIYVINKQSFGWTIDFHTPVALIVISLATTLLCSALAGLVPSRLASRIDIASAIKSE